MERIYDIALIFGIVHIVIMVILDNSMWTLGIVFILAGLLGRYGVILMRNYLQGEPDIWKIPHDLLKKLTALSE